MELRQLAARLAGAVTALPYRVRGRRLRIGPRLLGNGRLRIKGPGQVILGADVNAWSHAEINHLITTRREAVIRIGRQARLNGCTLIAADRIEVGDNCVLGSCDVRDALDHSESPDDRRRPDVPRPVLIGDNAWIGGQVSILPGVRIGANAVVGIHAVVFEDVPAGSIVVGNPARTVRVLGNERPGA
jgi:acetyltransferase-like isoleucine patch superfamily enzyme